MLYRKLPRAKDRHYSLPANHKSGVLIKSHGPWSLFHFFFLHLSLRHPSHNGRILRDIVYTLALAVSNVLSGRGHYPGDGRHDLHGQVCKRERERERSLERQNWRTSLFLATPARLSHRPTPYIERRTVYFPSLEPHYRATCAAPKLCSGTYPRYSVEKHIRTLIPTPWSMVAAILQNTTLSFRSPPS